MGIKPNFSPNDINKLFNVRLQRIEDAIISRLVFIGETFVRNARENGNYLDQTGNLRSSIGYIVLKNGKIFNENFEQSDRGSEKSKGVQTGKSLIKQIKSKLNVGYVLIVVAGMDYAAAVESRGKDVLTASSITAKNDLRKAISQLKSKIKSL